MKICLWYALREMRRRPKRFLSLIAVSAAVLTVMILSVLWQEALWRADVMPETPQNYHFSFYNLTESDKNYIKSHPWVQTTYDVYRESSDDAFVNRFCVRVKWEHNITAMKLAQEILHTRNLLSRAPYEKLYQREYEQQYNSLLIYWNGFTQKGGLTVEEAAASSAYAYILREHISHDAYMNKVTNSYTAQPGFLFLITLLALFLGAAVLMLQLETYRTNYGEYGCLRALGFRKSQLFFVNLAENLTVNLLAIPAAALFTAGILKLYFLITAPYAAEATEVYFTVAGFIPVPVLCVLAGYLLGSGLFSTFLVCFFHREKPIMSLLRREDAFRVPFVAKTSSLFENSRGIAAYCRLYALRARASLIRYAVVTALMLPLPMYYLLYGVIERPSDPVPAIYTAFQVAAVFITALAVTGSASRMQARSRERELGIVRALGGSRSTVRSVTYPVAALQGAAVLVLVLIVYYLIRGIFATGGYVGSTEGSVPLMQLLAENVLLTLSAGVFVIPSVFSGPAFFLFGFFRRSIITSVRETE